MNKNFQFLLSLSTQISLFETSLVTAICVSTFWLSSNASEELCLGLGQPHGSNKRTDSPFQNNALLPKSTKSVFLVPISDALQFPGTNFHKSTSVKAWIAFAQFSTQTFHSLSTDLIHQKQISTALFTESTNLFSKWQPNNCSPRMVKVVCGATFDFAVNKHTKHFFFFSKLSNKPKKNKPLKNYHKSNLAFQNFFLSNVF